MKIKTTAKERRHIRIRKKVKGTAQRPRLCVFRSLNHIYAQIIDDEASRTLVSASTLDKDFKDIKEHKGNVKYAKEVGIRIAKKALQSGITKVVFDRGGYKYHGRVKALAEGAREGGLNF